MGMIHVFNLVLHVPSLSSVEQLINVLEVNYKKYMLVNPFLRPFLRPLVVCQCIRRRLYINRNIKSSEKIFSCNLRAYFVI